VYNLTLQIAGIGIVERVVILGTPQTMDKAKWESVRKVVIFHLTSHPFNALVVHHLLYYFESKTEVFFNCIKSGVLTLWY